MKVSFFHLGAAYAYIEPYLRSLGLDVVVPPFSSRRTIPILSRSFDEQTSHTGLMSRLEAFVDLL